MPQLASGSAFGEFYANADYSITDDKTVGAEFYFAPDWALSGTTAEYVEGNADIGLPLNLACREASACPARLGYQFLDATAVGASYATWNAGVYWQMTDAVKLDVRYSDTSLSVADCGALMGSTGFECGAKVMATLSVDTAISTLTGSN